MKYLKLIFFLCLSVHVAAQTNQTPITSTTQESFPPTTPETGAGCLTDVLHQRQLQNNPQYNQRMQQMNQAIALMDHSSREQRASVIPVVVHIIHNNGAENISDAQVIAGIQHLNHAFANQGGYTNANGVNTGIKFCLAKQDPDGNFTTGINRVVSPLTNMTAETQDLELKELIRWDPTQYLNIWLVREIESLSMGGGIAGYAYFPAAHGTPIDGVVNEAGFFGSSVNNSKVHVHEVGHYLGLYHTFESGCTNNDCQTDGDRVCDTPPDNSSAALVCSLVPSINTCTSDEDDTSPNNPFRPVALGGLGDQNDMIENYMDYGRQSCQKWLTQGQSDRMNDALTLYRSSLLQSMGCSNPCTSPISTLFTADTTTIYPNTPVTFTIQNPSSATYTWTVNGNPAGTGDVLTYNNFNQTGLYTVTVTGDNGDPACGGSHSITVSVICEAQASFSMVNGGPYSPGATIGTNNLSQNATTYSWYLDGIFQHNNATFSQQFNTPGSHNLFLVAGNGSCLDTSYTHFFSIGDCNISGMNNNWVFNHLHLNFSGGGPTVVGNSPITAGGQESTTTISDPDGNLLFFSDGTKVWDRNHNLMPNGDGLMGHSSSTQSCLATPFPGNPNLYYLFTTDGIENNLDNGLRYSIIDMSLNNGLGDVVPGAKNIIIRNDVGEMLSGTFHANGHDIWITVAKKTGNTFFAYLLSSQGISPLPVVSNVGTGNNSGLGPMKFSPGGNKLASATMGSWPWSVVLADFNRETGELMNGMNLWLSNVTNYQPHSMEFSPDGSKLYVQHWQAGQIWQYDLAAGGYNDIIASQTVANPQTSYVHFGQMCRANDGKIYFSAYSRLDYIAHPNLPGMACGYTTGQINTSFPPYFSSSIPNMIQGLGQAYIPSIYGKAAVCPGEIVHYTVPYLTSDQSVTWQHTGSGTLTANGSSATLNNLSGNAAISITVTGNCGIYHDTLHVGIVQPQQVSLGNDTALCSDLYLAASPSGQFSSYLWNTGSVATSIIATPPGTYWVETKDHNGCIDRDTIVLGLPMTDLVSLGQDTAICGNPNLVLDAGQGFISYLWQDGSTQPTHTVSQHGIYWVEVSDGCYMDRDSMEVSIKTLNIQLTHNGSHTVCAGSLPITLHAPAGYASYLWQNGSSAGNLLINSVGTYHVTVTDEEGCTGSDTLYVVSCLGIEDNTPFEVSIYPVPANESFTIALKESVPSTVYLYDASGKMIFSEHFTGNSTTINTQRYAGGIYTVELRTHNQIWRQKLVVMH